VEGGHGFFMEIKNFKEKDLENYLKKIKKEI